jgi:hypothetical protein
MAVIQSLNYCQWSMDYEADEKDDLTGVMSKTITRNNRLENAKNSIKNYLDDKNEIVKTISKGMTLGIDLLIDSNNKMIEKIRGMSNLDEKALRDVEYDFARIGAQNKEGWQAIGLSAAWIMAVFAEFGKTENPKGKIPFKISDKERQYLRTEIEKLFKDRLKRFENYRSLQKAGKEGDPNDQTWLIVTVDRIKQTLSVETYEEAKGKGL